MVSRLVFIGAAALVLLLVMGAIMQVAPVLAGITPTATATAVSPTATPTAEATASTVTPSATPMQFLPSTGGEVQRLSNLGYLAVALAGALLVLLAVSTRALAKTR